MFGSQKNASNLRLFTKSLPMLPHPPVALYSLPVRQVKRHFFVLYPQHRTFPVPRTIWFHSFSHQSSAPQIPSESLVRRSWGVFGVHRGQLFLPVLPNEFNDGLIGSEVNKWLVYNHNFFVFGFSVSLRNNSWTLGSQPRSIELTCNWKKGTVTPLIIVDVCFQIIFTIMIILSR